MRKERLEQEQEKMRKRQMASRRATDRRRKIDPDDVLKRAAIGLSVRDIASELGCSEDLLYTSYREVIENGRLMGGAMVRKVIFQKAMERDSHALAYLHAQLNNEELNPPVGGEKKKRTPSSRTGRAPRAAAKKQLARNAARGQETRQSTALTRAEIAAIEQMAREWGKRLANGAPDLFADSASLRRPARGRRSRSASGETRDE